MRGKVEGADRVIARIAARAHGIATRKELLGAGVTRGQIEHRLASGTLIPEYRGVYRVGHDAPSAEARYMAAVKAGGKGAVLSGRAAAWLLGLVRGAAPEPELTVPRRCEIKGLATRESRTHHGERTRYKGIPVTTVARTLVDIAPDLSEDALARAVHEAKVKHRTTPRQVEAVLARRPNATGAAKLRRVIHGHAPVSLSALERKFLQALRAAGLPLPDHTNKHAGAHRVDCRWTEKKLTVELDSYRFHNSRHSWQQDREREREAYARGDQHRRYTYEDVYVTPTRMLAELRAMLPAP